MDEIREVRILFAMVAEAVYLFTTSTLVKLSSISSSISDIVVKSVCYEQRREPCVLLARNAPCAQPPKKFVKQKFVKQKIYEIEFFCFSRFLASKYR